MSWSVYRAEFDVLDDVVVSAKPMKLAHKLCVAEPHRCRRKAVADVRLNVFVITYMYVTAPSSS